MRMKKLAVLFILFSMLSFAITASDLTFSRFTDTDEVFIRTASMRDCVEVNPVGVVLPFRWVFYLTDDYAEFRFWWPDNRRMSAPGWKTRYTISVLTANGERYSFEGYTPDSYAIRIDGEVEYIDFRNCLYENRGVIEFEIFQHDYRSSLVHSPWHLYKMGKVDISDIDTIYQNAYGESLFIDKVTDPSSWLVGISLGPSLTPLGNEPDEANARFGLEVAYLPYKVGSFSLGARADVSVLQKNVASDVYLFDMSVALYMSNFFFVNRNFSMRVEYGIGAGYIHSPGATRYASDSFTLRVPLAVSFIVSRNWNIGLDIMFDFIPAFGYDSGIVALAGGGVSFRYGF